VGDNKPEKGHGNMPFACSFI